MIAAFEGKFPEIAQFIRFGISGGLSTLCYGIFTLLLTYITPWSPFLLHTVAYLLSIPISYLMQRDFSFRDRGSKLKSFKKFVIAIFFTFLLSSILIFITASIGAPPWAGTVLVMVVVPLVSYMIMKHWIFLEKKDSLSGKVIKQ